MGMGVWEPMIESNLLDRDCSWAGLGEASRNNGDCA